MCSQERIYYLLEQINLLDFLLPSPLSCGHSQVHQYSQEVKFCPCCLDIDINMYFHPLSMCWLFFIFLDHSARWNWKRFRSSIWYIRNCKTVSNFSRLLVVIFGYPWVCISCTLIPVFIVAFKKYYLVENPHKELFLIIFISVTIYCFFKLYTVLVWYSSIHKWLSSADMHWSFLDFERLVWKLWSR